VEFVNRTQQKVFEVLMIQGYLFVFLDLQVSYECQSGKSNFEAARRAN
jgi:hypothetical protein